MRGIIVTVVLALSPTPAAAWAPGTLDACWPRPEMVLVIKGEHPAYHPAVTATEYWASMVPIRFRFVYWLPTMTVPDPAAIVAVEMAGAHPRGDLAEIRIGRHARKPRCWEIGDASIQIYDGYPLMSREVQAQILAHEIGHLLGLPHEPDTLMDAVALPGFILSQHQLDLLNRTYRKPLKRNRP